MQAPDRSTAEAPPPPRAVPTPDFLAPSRRLGASLLITTSHAGKLAMVRDEADHLNTHFRAFEAPAGMALAGDRLAVGTTRRHRRAQIKAIAVETRRSSGDL